MSLTDIEFVVDPDIEHDDGLVVMIDAYAGDAFISDYKDRKIAIEHAIKGAVTQTENHIVNGGYTSIAGLTEAILERWDRDINS